MLNEVSALQEMVALGLGHIDRHLLRCGAGLQIASDLITGGFPVKSIPDKMAEASPIRGAARRHVGLGAAESRIGERVWVYAAYRRRPLGRPPSMWWFHSRTPRNFRARSILTPPPEATQQSVSGVAPRQFQSFPETRVWRVGSRRPAKSVREQLRPPIVAPFLISRPSRWCATCVSRTRRRVPRHLCRNVGMQ